jgi:hypothetical protein
MKNILILMLVVISGCQNKSAQVVAPNEYQLQTLEKMGTDQLMCSHEICVTEEEMYQQKGSQIYAMEEKLYYLKYEMLKTILIQKIVEEKIKGTKQTFEDFHRQLKEKVKVSDQEVSQYLKTVGVDNLTPDAPAFVEVKNKMILEKTNEEYLKILNSFKGSKEILVNIQKKYKKPLVLPFAKLVNYENTKNDELKITLMMNPNKPERIGIIRLAEGLTGYLKSTGKKVSWYFLPFSNEENDSGMYQKMFICSMEKDRGSAFKSLIDTSKTFNALEEAFEFLEKRKVKIDSIKKCVQSAETQKRMNEMNEFIATNKLSKVNQIIYNGDIEYHIPGMMELGDRIALKLRLFNSRK